MGLAMRGLTHCEKCGKTLNYDECVLCKSCEKEKEGGQAMTLEQAVERANKIIKTKFNNDYSIDNVDKEAIEIVLSMLEEKDKIIDEMAKTINEAYYGSGDFEEWFENKICKIQRYEDYTYLEKDIKQYFENKAKE